MADIYVLDLRAPRYTGDDAASNINSVASAAASVDVAHRDGEFWAVLQHKLVCLANVRFPFATATVSVDRSLRYSLPQSM
jgi:hypothetical protein